MEELKDRWCADLEDILQCPVCFERPQRPIYQCRDGHHICSSCRMKLQVCPMCQGAYNGSRSFIAEHLALKLDDIKSSLLQPPVERQIVSNFTQTEEPEIAPEIKLSHPLAPKGKFPCRMGKCEFDDGHCRMLNHLRYCHKDRLCESTSIDGKIYTRQWEMDHLSNIEFDLAFSIPEMGIFFLITSIDSSGNFMGNVQMVHTNNVAKEFNCKLEMNGNHRTCSYEGFPRSCRTPADVAFNNSLHISSQDMRRMADKRNKVTCIFTITREEKKNIPVEKNAK
ncbi:E3 ubiquitin-protein ligase SIAH1A-like isoform X2 [Belonocnema kinseyi]|uniref:E3 ubiquitin-protein ligase SIAH1A-like isoform X2 n=1 Tax=Belonocnema kinseyi TaxID=2817044 RepID=UPI00143D94FC|nr:E3 ubiquitin-protein ligase SIAH1A-like isoform X2 [Belonocnema kinseyi]